MCISYFDCSHFWFLSFAVHFIGFDNFAIVHLQITRKKIRIRLEEQMNE